MKISKNITKAIDSIIKANQAESGSKQQGFYNSRADVYLNRSQGIDDRHANFKRFYKYSKETQMYCYFISKNNRCGNEYSNKTVNPYGSVWRCHRNGKIEIVIDNYSGEKLKFRKVFESLEEVSNYLGW